MRQVFYIAQGSGARPRDSADHDAHVVAACAAHAQRLGAKKALPHLTGQIRQRQAQDARLGFQGQAHLDFAGAKVVLNVKNPRSRYPAPP